MLVGRILPLMRSESQVIKKLLTPLLKDDYFAKTSVRVDRIHSKLATEGALSQEEISIQHPFHPDIDVLFWKKEYSGEPVIRASEVKYFRLKEGAMYPTIYEGLGEALMLLTYGLDYVYLWHLFDPEIPSETVSRYRDLTENLITGTNSPINYRSWLLSDIPQSSTGESVTQDELLAKVSVVAETIMRSSFFSSIVLNLKLNPIRYRWDAKILRSIIKKNFRIINR